MLKKKTVQTALDTAKKRLADLDAKLGQAQALIGQITEQRLVAIGQVDALTHVLSEEKPNA